ncbi:MAG: hypothetical protein V3T49_03500 [Dehalococcoidia bacterium]
MSPKNNPRKFKEQARENRLEISIEDAEMVNELMGDVEASYTVIRDIDTTGFEPAAIFVPTQSKRESN